MARRRTPAEPLKKRSVPATGPRGSAGGRAHSPSVCTLVIRSSRLIIAKMFIANHPGLRWRRSATWLAVRPMSGSVPSAGPAGSACRCSTPARGHSGAGDLPGGRRHLSGPVRNPGRRPRHRAAGGFGAKPAEGVARTTTYWGHTFACWVLYLQCVPGVSALSATCRLGQDHIGRQMGAVQGPDLPAGQ